MFYSGRSLQYFSLIAKFRIANCTVLLKHALICQEQLIVS